MNENKIEDKNNIVKYKKTPTEKAIFKGACIVLPITSIITIIEVIRYIYWHLDDPTFVIPLGIVIGCTFIILDY